MFCFHAGWGQLFLCTQELPAVDLKCQQERILPQSSWIRSTSKKVWPLPEDNHIIYVSAIEDDVFSKGVVGPYMKTCPVSHIDITGAKFVRSCPNLLYKEVLKETKIVVVEYTILCLHYESVFKMFKLLRLAKQKYSRACRPIGWGVDVYKDKPSRETQIHSAYHA